MTGQRGSRSLCTNAGRQRLTTASWTNPGRRGGITHAGVLPGILLEKDEYKDHDDAAFGIAAAAMTHRM